MDNRPVFQVGTRQILAKYQPARCRKIDHDLFRPTARLERIMLSLNPNRPFRK
jgi:hypothetical protein